jgi:hypothetical protein
MKLYEITQELETLEAMYELVYDEETGEVNELDFNELQAMEEEMKNLLSNKSDAIIKFVKNMDSDITVLKEEEKRLKERREKLEKKKEWLKNYLMENMLKLGYTKVESTYGTLSTRKSKSTIINENIIAKDPRYWSVETKDKFDKNKIKKLIESGEEIVGAYIQENTSVVIK